MPESRVEPSGEGRWRVVGEMTFATVGDLLRKSDLFGASKDVALDLSGVVRADSAGIALLLEWMRRADEGGSAIRFEGMPHQMLEIARVSGLEDIIPLH